MDFRNHELLRHLAFIGWTLRLLTDTAYRAQIARNNLEVCQRFYSLDVLEQQLNEIFGPS